ncbi:hypothetical protein BLOT_005844 [Blomia tropicalis]|nr:hypothetical protein BLOT_005844 [Blomia tropicalis]
MVQTRFQQKKAVDSKTPILSASKSAFENLFNPVTAIPTISTFPQTEAITLVLEQKHEAIYRNI